MPSFSSSSSGPVQNPGAMGLYNQQSALQQNNYGSIVSGYNQAQANASAQLQGIYAGYGALSNTVLNTLGVTGGGWGVAAPAAQAIERQYTQSQGHSQQQLINSGLGNSTLLSNVMNQGNQQAAQAYGNLGAQLAGQAAGAQQQIGLAGLNAQQSGTGMQLGSANSFLGNLSHFNFSPNVDLYGQQQQSSSSQTGGGGGGGSGGGGHQTGGHMNTNPYTNFGTGAGMGSSGAYTQGGYGGGNPYATNSGGGEQTLNFGDLYDYDLGGNYGGGWTDQYAMGDNGDFGGGGSF